MSDSEDKRKHLEFIQGVINRLASNTFLFKGWSITITCAVLAAIVATDNVEFAWIIIGAAVVFWLVDAYYLMLERQYRQLYSEVSVKVPGDIDYSMKVAGGCSVRNFIGAVIRPILLLFYGSIIVVSFCIIFFNNYSICIISR